MAEDVPRERRATTCRGNGSERRPADPTVDLQKQITTGARGCDFTHGCASVNVNEAGC